MKLKEKKAELLIILFFCLFNLRVLNWFEYPNILISGDSRPPLNREAFLKRAFNTWDETDFGLLSVYQPRILDPYYLLITIIQTLGASLYLAQIITIFLMYSLSSILMYIYVKQITEGDKIAAFVAAIFLTSNIYLITDRDATAIPFIDTIMMILPSIVCFIKCIKEESYVLATVAGLLFILTYGTFPNYRTTLFGFLILTLTLIYIYGKNGIKVQYRKNETSSVSFSLDTKLLCTHLKYLIVFCIAFLSASIWIFVSVSAGIKHFLTTLQNVSMPLWVIKSLKLYDVFRLIAKWGFYSGALGKPYVPYAESYFNNSLLVLLSYIPPILAFAAVLLPHSKKLTTYFSGIALLSLILISVPLPELYSSLTYYLPFMIVLRESAQWAILLIISYGILLGKTVSFIHRNLSNSSLQVTTLCLILVLLIFTAYPLTTGDVSKNWLNPDYKGSYLPNSYVEINNVVSSEYWSLLIPLRETYVSYNLSKIPLNAGNPYPLIFSKPIISGLGTEYVQSQNLDLIKKIHEIMLNKRYVNIAPYGTASASSNQNETLSSNLAIDRDYNTRWASAPSMPQWIEIAWNSTQELSKIRIIFESAFANDYVIETWNGTCWEKQIEVRNNTSLQPEYFFQQPIPTTKLRITFTKASVFNMVSIWELEAYAQTEGVSKFLGILGIKYLILEKCLILGKAYDVSELHINQSKNFILIKEWNEIDLYDNTHALQKLYTATNILKYNTLDEMYNIIDETEWEKLQNSALINSTEIKNSEIYGLVPPEDFTWEELSPTSYEAHVNSRGPFFLVLLETHDEHWKVYVNGKPVPEGNHYKVNAFANGWLINETGTLTISIQYETQNLIPISAIPSITIPLSLIVFFGRKNLKKIGKLLYYKLKFIKTFLKRP